MNTIEAGSPSPDAAAMPPGIGRSRGNGATWPRLVLVAALVLPALALAALAWEAWRDAWDAARRELARQAEAGAEYALRVTEGQRLAADLANDLLAGLTDDEIRARETELHAALRARLPRLPLVQTLYVLDREARPLVTANVVPVPRDVTFADREWVRALAAPGAPDLHISSVVVGRVDNNLFYGLTRRRSGSGNGLPADAYDGVVNVSVNPNTLVTGFLALGGEPGDITSLVRADGQILARTPGLARPLPAVPAGSPLPGLAAAGVERGLYMGRTLGLEGDRPGEARLVAFRRVGAGLPLYVTAARPTPIIAGRWRGAVARQMTVGVPTWLALVGLAWLALRRSREAEAAEAARAAAEAERAVAEARRAAEARFRGVFESRAIGMSVFDATTGETLLANDRLLEMTGGTRAAFEAGRWDWRQVTPPEFLPLDALAIGEARARGWWDPYEKEYLRPDGSRLPVRLSSAPLPGEPGRVVVLAQDISEQREAEQRRDLLAREVDHRAKNMLAVVQAALRLTPKHDAVSYAREVEGRVAALARAHGLLAATRWAGAPLRAVVEAELAAFLPEAAGAAGATAPRVEALGPELLLSSAASQSLALALHELATNATKYGALAAPGGRVTVRWEADRAAGVMRIVWEERGGPPVAGPPTRRGFGSRMVEAVLGGQLAGRVERRWEAEGLICRMELPLDRALVPAITQDSAVATG